MSNLVAASACLCGCLLLVLLLAVHSVGGSYGDTDRAFLLCLQHYGPAFSGPLPLHLRLLGWTPEAEARYHCMHLVTRWRSERGLGHLQYFGKWPFKRVVGIQEPASLLASLGNLYVEIVAPSY